MRTYKKSSLTLLIILAIVLLISPLAPAATADDLALAQAKQILANYAYLLDDETILQKNDIGEIMAALAQKDAYAHYYTPEEFANFQNYLDNKTIGTGFVYVYEEGQGFRVKQVFNNGTAAQAGLKMGDLITQADGKTVTDLTEEEQTELMTPKEGRVLTLTVKRGDATLVISPAMKQMEFPAVQYEMLDDKTGYIVFYAFNSSAVEEMRQGMDYLLAQGMQVLFLDMSANGGGYVDTAMQILDMFMGKTLIGYEKGPNGYKVSFRTKDDVYYDLPVIIFASGDTASASEITLAALQDNHKAIIIGTQTAGVGYYKYSFALANGSAITFVGGENLRPGDSSSLEGVGVSPDIYAAEPEAMLDDAIALADAYLYKKDIKMTIGNAQALANGENYQLNAPPIEQDGYTYTPLRSTAAALGLTVSYQNGKAYVISADRKAEINVSSGMTTNGIKRGMILTLEKNGSLLVPSSFWLEYFGYNVQWYGPDHTIYISNNRY